jgi:ubiquinone/menaquinone biosynthesis C-methylase UbiE
MSKKGDKKERVCPWWMGYLLANPVRKLLQDPKQIIEPYVREGMTTLDIGPGMGYFTLPMAAMVGDTGRVIAVDLQEKMLDSLKRRADRAGLAGRIETRLCTVTSLNIDDLSERVDFALTFAVLHEMLDIPHALKSIGRTLRPGGTLLIAEPTGHVSEVAFGKTIAAAEACGLSMIDQPSIRRSRTALLTKNR